MTRKRKLTSHDLAKIEELRYVDGLTGGEVARMFAVSARTIHHYAPGRPGKVSNTRVRAMFERSPMTAADVAREMGWLYEQNNVLKADTGRVRRALALVDDVSGRTGTRSRRTLIDAETAGLLAEAMGYEAWEAIPDGDDLEAAA
jgi:hypothetical protein